jgi:hypothetical protein
MKKILYTLTIISVFAFLSCSDDFLKEMPTDDIFADNLLVNYTGFQNMQNGLFALVRDEYDRVDKNYGGTSFRSLPFAKHTLFSVGADNSWGNNRHSQFAHLSFPKNITYMADFEAFLAMFEWLYKVVNTANMIITRAENPDIDWQGGSTAADQANKERTVANARLIRAWAYRHLTYSFGAVPLSLEEVTGSNYRTDWERTPVSVIREAMEQDLLYAVEKLPMRTANNTVPSQAIARHYLGELYLAMSRDLDAKNILQPLVEGADYTLMTTRFGANASNPGNPFIDVFRSPLYSQGNQEVLWAFLNTEPENAAYGVGPNVFMRNMWKNYYSDLSTIRSLSHPQYPGQTLQLFWSLNGGKGAGRCAISLGTHALYTFKDQADDDIRYDEHSMVWHLYFLNPANEVYEVQTSGGSSMINLNQSAKMSDDTDPTIKQYNLPSTRKWDYTHPFFEQASIDQQYNDVVYLRLAETYLLYAEALYKLGQGGEFWVNKIRERAGVEFIDGGEMSIDMILDERTRELITEEHRRHTLIRLSQEDGGDERLASNFFKTRTRLHNEVSGREVRGMHDDVTPVLFPIPKTFIDSNSGRLIEQNPGY